MKINGIKIDIQPQGFVRFNFMKNIYSFKPVIILSISSHYP